ncbi:hypothetical protein N836_23980 [Leptolyngbya sp. Heron Island J]|uniref:glycine-rich domain-containing protein n=1 Tax=Leptolyngbya sp. Heron Island J TaxID=1385935 RepID=UPI0003B94828|nr:hypothetical protein [Leptolyngbya sp. Heron Island J]ESA32899.1 hypothetical protein N836_23980 [Leptolyngbya sp. Heron Island J]
MVDTEELAGESAQSMTAEQLELYERLQSFSLDQEDVQLSFSKRLARDNGWSMQYAGRAVDEYKKFVFLAIAAGHPVTPSDQVDQVWHLHLTYTRSYWGDFCSKVLQTPLHHDPTRGGDDENEKFYDWYRKTLESYEQFFEQQPPVDIWPAPEERFDRDLQFVRINTQQNWILPKLLLQKGAIASFAILFSLILSGYYLNSVEGHFNPPAVVGLAAILVASGFGAIRMVSGIVEFINNPSRPRIGGGCSGIGLIACGGWDSGHHSGGGGGCGSSGCGGGGCGGS